jgi:phosphoserine phosphatase
MKELIEKVREEYGIELNDENDMTGAWKLVEALKEKGWVVYIITAKGREQVDAWHSNYGSLYAQFGEIPLFKNVVEGICVTALHIKELERNGTL